MRLEKRFTERLLLECKAKRFGQAIFWRDEVESTNLWAKQAAKQSLADGDYKEGEALLFTAESQSAGRGRFGRKWESPAGENLYMTLLLMKPEIKPENASQLTLVMGLSVAQAVKELLGKPGGIKYPNDVVLSGKKICGILTEMQVKDGLAEYILTGVGINVNQTVFPEELQDKATSLKLQRGGAEDFDKVLAAARTLEAFERNYQLFLQKQNLALLKADYEALLLNKDAQVRIQEKQGSYCAVARGITNTGELLVERESGEIQKVFSGEVSVRGLYHYV